MTIDYLFLARTADSAADGTFSVTAGGLDTVVVPECPGAFGVAVVGRLSGIPDAVARLDGELDFLDPAGVSMFADRVCLPVIRPPAGGRGAVVGQFQPGVENFLLDLDALPFDGPGRHRLTLRFTSPGMAVLEGRAEIDLTIEVGDVGVRDDSSA
jgi:hypothetical protein